MRPIMNLWATALVAALPAIGQAQTSPRGDDSLQNAQSKTDAETDTNAGPTAAPGSGPIAFGVVLNDGTKQSGTANWSSSFNSSLKRYEIAISGESYFYLNYSTLITPTGDVRFCRSDSVGGKLLVYCYDQSGAVQPARFSFTTFKAP